MSTIAKEVTIASANFNNGPFLRDYFESILASTQRPERCIICDDGSTDGSQDIIAEYADQHDWIQPIYFAENRGVAHATNAAIDEVSTSLVLRIDTDDMLMPERISAQAEFMHAHPEVDVLGGNCTYFDGATGEELHNSSFPTTHADILALFRQGENGVLNGTTMVRTEWFRRHAYDQEMVWAEDYDVFARMIHEGATFAGQSHALTKVRIHRGSVTSNLDIDTLHKANEIAGRLFGQKKSQREMDHYYGHLLHYRKYMMTTSPLSRLYHLAAAIYHRPSKLVQRLFGR